jgi:predicted NodU family carbamoyl transferase
MDAAGEVSSTSVYLCEGTRIRRLARYPINQSLGIFYSLITQFLGYAFQLRRSAALRRFLQDCDPPDAERRRPNPRSDTEPQLRRRTVLHQQRRHYPAGPGDRRPELRATRPRGGTALGAAAACAFARSKPLRLPGIMPFFGPALQLERVKQLVAQNSALTLEEFSDENAMLDSAAEDIADDLIVALCNGRMGYRARALGNRNLLALPANATNKGRINVAIKKRQNYRPFAPAVIAQDAHRYFVLNAGEQYPYMTMLTHVPEEGSRCCPPLLTSTARPACRPWTASITPLSIGCCPA